MSLLQDQFRKTASNIDAGIGPHGETVLHMAAQEGNTEIAQKAIEKGATIFVMDRHNNSPLLYAAARGDAAMIRLLLAGDKKGIDYSGTLGTALGIVARAGNIDAAAALLDAGANIDAPDEMGSTPLMDAAHAGEAAMVKFLLARGADANVYRAGESALHLAARKGDPVIIDMLLAGDGIRALQQQSDLRKMTPLHIAVLTSQHVAAEKFLNAGALTSLKNAQGFTAVEMAAHQGDAKMIRLLVEKGHADLRVTSGEDRFTPLHRAVYEGKVDAALELIRLGADPEAKDAKGRTVLEVAAARGTLDIVKALIENYPVPLQTGAAALYAAIAAEQAGTATYLLRSKRIDLNTPTRDGHYALLAALEKYDIPLVREMLDAGAKTDLADRQSGETPLYFSARMGRSFFGEELIKHHANVNAVVNGNAALHAATLNKHREMVRVLLEGGADPFAKNAEGRTARQIANDNGLKDIAELLEKAETEYITPKRFPKSASPSP